MVYPGVIEGIEMLAADGLPLGCVTNKPSAFTLPLLRATGLAKYFAVIVSGDTVARRRGDAELLAATGRLAWTPPGRA